MASHSGIRARDFDRGEYSRKPIIKDAAGYGAWKVKTETILDANDCWEIVQGTQLEPLDLAQVIDFDAEGAAVDNPRTAADVIAITARREEIKDWRRRFKKAASLITQSVDDGIVQTLSVHGKDPKLMWDALSADYNTVTPVQQSLARQDFQAFRVTEDETYVGIGVIWPSSQSGNFRIVSPVMAVAERAFICDHVDECRIVIGC